MIDAVKKLRALADELIDSGGANVEGHCYWCDAPSWSLPGASHASDCPMMRAQAALAASATLEARLVALERLLGAVRERQAALAAMDIDEHDHDDAWWEQVTAASARLVDNDKEIVVALAELDAEASQ